MRPSAVNVAIAVPLMTPPNQPSPDNPMCRADPTAVLFRDARHLKRCSDKQKLFIMAKSTPAAFL
jgi:hypothetical protein